MTSGRHTKIWVRVSEKEVMEGNNSPPKSQKLEDEWVIQESKGNSYGQNEGAR